MIIICLVAIFVSNIFGQNSGSDEAAIKKVADYIINHAEFKFEGVDNGKIYNTTDEIPEDVNVKLKSSFAEWHYTIGVLNMAMIDNRYSSIATTGWDGLKKEKILPDGQVKDIFSGTGIENDMVFYYNRPARLNEKHGLGPVIDAGIKVIRLKISNKKIHNTL